MPQALGRPQRGDTTGTGRAHGAITILNATATGIGCSLAVRGGMEATWTWEDHAGLRWDAAGVDDRVARAVLDHVQATRRDVSAGARAGTVSPWPPARGLKTSSSAAAALLGAALRGLGEMPRPAALAREAVAVARRAGVTLTGAYDDQLAVTLGGCHLADNLNLQDLGPLPTGAWLVAVWVPEARIDKALLGGLDPMPVAGAARRAESLARAGRVAEAITENGRAFHAHYKHMGLDVDDAPTHAALDAGALGAGLSGTGPAVAALFDAPRDLEPVPGGAWRWTRIEGEAP